MQRAIKLWQLGLLPYGLNVGEITLVPISHGEGRFVANDSEIQHLIKNGQVVFQYVDYDGNATMQMPLNPNGSMYGIEALCSPNGRILGKMGHSERIGENLYRNVFGKYDQKIFESGVNYLGSNFLFIISLQFWELKYDLKNTQMRDIHNSWKNFKEL